MAEVVLPSQTSPGMGSAIVDDRGDIDANCSPYSLNQAFAFPPQQPSTSVPGGGQSLAGSSRAMPHRTRPSNLALSNLPAFEFGIPGSPASLKPSPSPTRSPVRLTPPVHVGHKRGGSEFVGGDLTGAGPVLIPTIATDDTRPPSAPSSPARGPPSTWRGHAHRRSHAVSQSDAKSMMQPPVQNLGGSLPVTPSEDPTRNLANGPTRSMSHDPMPLHSRSKSNLSSALSAHSRPRVEFSDTTEIIPRPLSTISSETSSSMSTIRMTHSLSESAGSLHAMGTSSPPAQRATSYAGDSRSLAGQHTLTFSSDSPLSAAPENMIDSVPEDMYGDQQKYDQEASGWASFSAGSSFDQASPFDFECAGRSFMASKPRTPGQTQDECPSPHTNLGQDSPVIRPKTSPDSKSPHNSPRVRNWADTLMHRKAKRDMGGFRRAHGLQQVSQTIEVQEPQFSLEDISFDDDTTMIIEEPSTAAPTQRSSVSQTENLEGSANYPTPSPIIDLDFAMSFSDSSFDGSGDYSGRGSGQKRRLHSSGETGGFSGPGMHYHRRTESAPEMDAFEGSRFGFPRFGSNPAMEEAIAEEDEEPDRDDAFDESHVLGLGVNIVDEDLDVDDTSVHDIPPQNESRRVIRRILTPPDTLAVQPVEIFDPEEQPRISMITKSSDDSSITPTVTPDPFATRPASAPLDFAIQSPSLTYGTVQETRSNVSSADYRQTSFEFKEPRLHTARSSITDRITLNSSKAGNMSAASSEDVPSLTSSASTVMSGLPPRMAGESTARSASFSGPVTARSRPGSSSKRASLASLSKLMGGPYNKSKLNIAETLRPDSPSPEKIHRKKHRISRMMKFWKSKESLPDR